MKTIADRALASALRANGIRSSAEIPRLVSLCWTEHRLEAQLPYTGVTSLAGLEVCTELEVVELGGEVVDLSPIAHAPKLRSLWIHLAPNCSYAPLATATALVELSLTGGRGDVASLGTLHQLQKLVLEKTSIEDLTPIADLPALREVSLWTARMLDVAPGTKNREVLLEWVARGVKLHHPSRDEIEHEANERAIARGGTSLADRVRQLGDPGVATLLERGGTDPDVNTALHLAAKGTNLEIVRAIVDAGVVPIDAVNREGKTALAVAASQYKSNVDVVRLLVEHGANVDVAMPFVIDRWKSRDEQKAVLDLLVPRLTRPWTTDEIIGLIYMGDVARVEAALAKNEVKVRELGKTWRQTVLHAAADVDNIELVRTLLAAGADPTSNTPMGAGYGTPLHRGGSVEIAALLLDAGADVNALEVTNDEPPLISAAMGLHFEKCNLLIERGANVNAVMFGQQTVLHRLTYARDAPDDDRARLFYDRLLAAGIDLEAKNAEGKTTHDLATGDFKRALTRMRKSREPPKPKRSAKKPVKEP